MCAVMLPCEMRRRSGAEWPIEASASAAKPAETSASAAKPAESQPSGPLADYGSPEYGDCSDSSEPEWRVLGAKPAQPLFRWQMRC